MPTAEVKIANSVTAQSLAEEWYGKKLEPGTSAPKGSISVEVGDEVFYFDEGREQDYNCTAFRTSMKLAGIVFER